MGALDFGDSLMNDAIEVLEKYGFTWPLATKEPPRRWVQPCGTRAAYQRHQRHGETPCDTCREASRNYRPPDETTVRCGTLSGHTRHVQRREEACQPCKAARAAYARKATA
jgi:uncharacterized protein (DUF3084 family)